MKKTLYFPNVLLTLSLLRYIDLLSMSRDTCYMTICHVLVAVQMLGDTAWSNRDDPFDALFPETGSRKHVLRAILVDL